MLTNFINYVAKIKITITQWILGFIGIIFIRFFLENISSHNNLGIITSDLSTLLHYSLFYLGLLLSLVLCLKIFIPIKLTTLTKLSLFILPIIWLAPIMDLFISWGAGFNMSYNFHLAPQIFSDFITFFGNLNSGITFGIRIEIFILLIGIFLLTYKFSKKIGQAILATVLCYVIFFLWSAVPSIIFMVANIITHNYNEAYVFITASANNSIISQNFLQSGIEFTTSIRKNEILFNYTLIQIYIIINFILLFIWSFLCNKTHLISIIKNSRPRRIIFYLSFFIIGLVIASKNLKPDILWHWIDVITFLNLLIGYYCVWMFSVGTNDIEDRAIDQISNKNRPLITKLITEESLKNFNLIFLILSLVAAYATGTYTLFFVIIFIFSSYIYSAPPLRLKKIPGISTFLISMAALSVAMSSFYLINPDKSITAFPISISLLIIIIVTITANIKDLKDFQGDYADHIRTIPTIFGINRGKKIISIITALSFLLIPIILKNYLMLVPAIVIAILSYYLINRQNFVEKQMFYLYFIFILILLIQY